MFLSQQWSCYHLYNEISSLNLGKLTIYLLPCLPCPEVIIQFYEVPRDHGSPSPRADVLLLLICPKGRHQCHPSKKKKKKEGRQEEEKVTLSAGEVQPGVSLKLNLDW